MSKRAAAYHEAGHVLGAKGCGNQVNWARLITKAGEWKGETEALLGQDRLQRAVYFVAGDAAEALCGESLNALAATTDYAELEKLAYASAGYEVADKFRMIASDRKKVEAFIKEAQTRVRQILAGSHNKLNALAAALEEKESLDEVQIDEILGPQ